MNLFDKNDLVLKLPEQKFSKKELVNFFENYIHNGNIIYVESFVNDQLNNYDKDVITTMIKNIIINDSNRTAENISVRIEGSRINIFGMFDELVERYDNKKEFLSNFSNIEDLDFYNILFRSVMKNPHIKKRFKTEILNPEQTENVKELFKKINKLTPEFYKTWKDEILNHSFEYEIQTLLDYKLPYYVYRESLLFFSEYRKIIEHYSSFVYKPDYSQFVGYSYEFLLNVFQECSTDTVVLRKFINKNHVLVSKIIENINDDKLRQLILCIDDNNFENYYQFFSDFTKLTKFYDDKKVLLTENFKRYIEKNNMYDNFIDGLLENNNSFIINVAKEMNRELKEKLFDNINKKLNYNIHNLINDDELLGRYMNIIDVFSSGEYYSLKRKLDDIIRSKNNGVPPLDGVKSSTLITSHGTWGNRVMENPVEIEDEDTVLKLWMIYNSTNYHSKNRDCSLKWFLHIGHVDLNYVNNTFNVKLRLLPIQTIVLEHIGKNKNCNFETIRSIKCLKKYTDDDLLKIINIFKFNNIIDENEDGYFLNSQKDMSLNLINSFYQYSNMTNRWKLEEKEEFANDLIDIIKTQINHIVKISKITKEELYEKVNEINSHLNNENFNKALEYMISMDYIKNEGDCYEKLFY